MQTFERIYDHLDKKQKSKLIRKVLTETEMSANSFYQKRKNNSFSKLEREKIAEILSEPVDILFPENEHTIF